MKRKYIEAWNFMEVYIIYTTTCVCKQRVVALLLMELLSKMRKMRTITPPDATQLLMANKKLWISYLQMIHQAWN